MNVEVLQSIFYLLWIILLLGGIVFIITLFVVVMQLKSKIEKTADDVKSKVDAFVALKKNEMFMSMAGKVGSSIFTRFWRRK